MGLRERGHPTTNLSVSEAEALRRGGFNLKLMAVENPDVLAQTAAEYGTLCDTSLNVDEAARKLGVNPSRVRQLLAACKIYGLQVQVEGAWKIPVFQLEGDRLLPGLEEVVPALPKDLHPVGVYRWFMTPSPDLVPEGLDQELSPREWLLTGRSPGAVAKIAADLDRL